MSVTHTVLASVLSDIQNNRTQITEQLKQLDQSRANAMIQLAKFDTLIATLQISITDEKTGLLIDDQVKANDQLPLKVPVSGSADAAGGIAPDAAEDSLAGAGEVQGIPNKSRSAP